MNEKSNILKDLNLLYIKYYDQETTQKMEAMLINIVSKVYEEHMKLNIDKLQET